MRNSDARVRNVFVHGYDSDPNSIFAMQATGCNFQYGPNFGVSLDPTFWVAMLLRLLAECTHDWPLHGIVRILAASLVMKYCPVSKTLRNPASMQNLLTLTVCENLSIRSSYRCNRKC